MTVFDWDQIARPLLFTNPLVLAYWRAEVALNCQASLGRLKAICAERGADYEKTIAGLR